MISFYFSAAVVASVLIVTVGICSHRYFSYRESVASAENRPEVIDANPDTLRKLAHAEGRLAAYQEIGWWLNKLSEIKIKD